VIQSDPRQGVAPEDIILPEDVLRLAERLKIDAPSGASRTAAYPEPSASSLARRFAPNPSWMRAPQANPAEPAEPAKPQGRTPRSAWPLLSSLTAIAFAPAAALGAMLWLGSFEVFSLDGLFANTDLLPSGAPSTQASAALSIPVYPPQAEPALRTTRLGVARDDEMDRTAARPRVAPPPIAGFVVRSGEADRIEGLMAHGKKMIDVGYLVGARAYYRRAAEAGSGEAALAVGATYDPDIIARLGVQGIKPDPAQAATWYARAASLGVADRRIELSALTENWGSGTSGGGEAVAMEAQSAAQRAAAPKPARKPHSPASETTAVVAAPEPQRIAANSTANTIGAKPQLLASEEEPKPGPLSRFVRAAAGLTTKEEWMEVASPVNIRKAPSSTAGTYTVAQKGTKLRVVGREGNWVRIADPTTKLEGYIYTRFLKESSAP